MKKIISLFLLTATTGAYGCYFLEDALREKTDQYIIENAHELVDIFFEKEFPKGTSTSLLLAAVEDLVHLTILRKAPLFDTTEGKENRPTSVPVEEQTPSFNKIIVQVAGFLFSFREEKDRNELAIQFKKAINDRIKTKEDQGFRSITPCPNFFTA